MSAKSPGKTRTPKSPEPLTERSRPRIAQTQRKTAVALQQLAKPIIAAIDNGKIDRKLSEVLERLRVPDPDKVYWKRFTETPPVTVKDDKGTLEAVAILPKAAWSYLFLDGEYEELEYVEEEVFFADSTPALPSSCLRGKTAELFQILTEYGLRPYLRLCAADSGNGNVVIIYLRPYQLDFDAMGC